MAAVDRECGLPIESAGIGATLLDPVQLGDTKAYDLRATPPTELAGGLPAERAKEFYYWITGRARSPFINRRLAIRS